MGIDIGHCRSNPVQLYGVTASNSFLEYYISCNPNFGYEPYWDICCLLDMTSFGEVTIYEGWIVLGYNGLTPEIIMQRIDEYVYDLVQLLRNNRYNKGR